MQVERLEAELEVYQMKNSSLTKQAGHHHCIPQGLLESKVGDLFFSPCQVEGESHRLDQAMQSRESQNAKYEALLARLQSED